MFQHSFSRGLARITTAALTVACLSGPAQAAGYTLTALGNLAGGSNQSNAAGINDAGQVVGTSAAATGARAFLWDAVGGMQDLGVLPEGSGSSARGINNAGQVVGSSLHVSQPPRAFLWDPVGGMQYLGDLPGGIVRSDAHGINDAGQVVGSSAAEIGTNTGRRAFLWDAVGGMQDLGSLPGGGIGSDARGINNAGQVVGDSAAARGEPAFIWDPVGGMQDLVPGGSDSIALAINNSEQVVGASAGRAFLWDATNGMQDLGALPGDGYSHADDINDAGQVVGYSRYRVAGLCCYYHAFLWDAVGGMQNLNDLIDPGLGAILEFAHAINASGQIVGVGTIDGYSQAFLLTPIADVPVPAALPLMLGGIGLLASVARRRSKCVTHAAI
jgi:probable HAF family extracellular repeat protein